MLVTMIFITEIYYMYRNMLLEFPHNTHDNFLLDNGQQQKKKEKEKTNQPDVSI